MTGIRWTPEQHAAWEARKGGEKAKPPPKSKVVFASVAPVPKPRQSRYDKWQKRPRVVRYREFADKLRQIMEAEYEGGIAQFRQDVELKGLAVTFWIAPPKSWSEKKKVAHLGEPHRGRNDIDNLVKAVMDALFEQDCGVWRVSASKMWAMVEGISISAIA